MKIVCYKDNILKALNSVVKGVASKTPMPIVEGILNDLGIDFSSLIDKLISLNI